MFGRKLDFEWKSNFKRVWKLSDYEIIWISCFGMDVSLYFRQATISAVNEVWLKFWRKLMGFNSLL